MKTSCVFCDKIINKKPCQIKRAKTFGNFCNRDCAVKFERSKNGKKIMSDIRIELYKNGSKSGFQKGKENYTSKFGSPIKGKKLNPISEKTRHKMRMAHLGKKNPKLSDAKKRMYREEGKVVWNKGLTKSTDKRIRDLSIKVSTTRKQRIREGKINPLNIKKSYTKPEIEMLNIIKKNKLPFSYVGNGRVWFRGKNHSFNPDFFSKKFKVIIEVYGKYWHSLQKSKIKDKERIETYKKSGYKTIIVWDYELNNVQKVLNKIIPLLKMEVIK